MSKSKSRKRKNEDEYSLQTILEDDNTVDLDVAEPKAAARNVEKGDEQVRFHNYCQHRNSLKISFLFRLMKTNMEQRIIVKC
jgi:hypothetical protein